MCCIMRLLVECSLNAGNTMAVSEIILCLQHNALHLTSAITFEWMMQTLYLYIVSSNIQTFNNAPHSKNAKTIDSETKTDDDDYFSVYYIKGA